MSSLPETTPARGADGAPRAEPDPAAGEVASARAPRRVDRLWLALCLAAAAFALGSGVHWAVSHPFGTGYDETKYVIQINYDRQRLADDGVITYLRGTVTDDHVRPPGYRLLAAPVSWVVEPTPLSMRLTGIAVFAVTLGFVFATGHRLAGPSGGAVMTILVALCPIVAGPTYRFGTEFPLMLAIAMSVYFLARAWDQPRADAPGWIGLGVALALGMLAKVSFLVIAAPIAAATVLLRWLGWIRGPSIGWLVRAAALGAVLTSPWYIPNGREYLGYVRFAGEFTRGRIAEWDDYLYIMLNDVYALPWFVVIVAALVGIAFAGRSLARSPAHRSQWLLLAVLALSIVPLHFGHAFVSQNQNPRFLAPPTMLLLIGAAVLIAQMGWTRRRATTALLCSLLSLQAVTLAAPSFPMERPMAAKRPFYDRPMYFNSEFPQWDWSVLTDYCRERGIEVGRIGLLGLGLPLSEPQVEYPWVRRGERVRVDPIWLHTDGPFDMDAVVAAAERAAVVVTAPGYHGAHHDRNPLDNAHNADFAERMREHPDYIEAPDLPIDPRGEQPVSVFVRQDALARARADDRTEAAGGG